MARLSVVIPSRDEKFLEPTIRDLFRNRRGETEVIAVLDSERYPEGWRELVAEFPDLHTIHNGTSIGMRGSINKGVASAKSRGAKYVVKCDGHVMVDEGFDVKLQADMDRDWVVIPRRKRLDATNWKLTDTHKLDIDYHYLSFPDDPNDFGGPGLNGKVWEARARERLNKPEYEIDDEMSSQGSFWAMHTDYFYQLELMDEASYGPFWNEAQEILLKCWLSGGRGVINKKTWYAHLHKGKEHRRGYRLPESWLKQGRNHTMKWLYNEAWAKQTLPFKTLIDRFAPVPTWPENWEELVYGSSKSRSITGSTDRLGGDNFPAGIRDGDRKDGNSMSLKIHSATYGISDTETVDVTDTIRKLVQHDALDIVVNNSTLDVGNPFRGKKKTLTVNYSYDGSEEIISAQREEKEWLIIGRALIPAPSAVPLSHEEVEAAEAQVPVFTNAEPKPFPKFIGKGSGVAGNELYKVKVEPVDDDSKVRQVEARLRLDGGHPAALKPMMSAAALNDHLIRKFKITDRRLRGPMPIEIRDFHRDDLAVLFAELGFKRGAEIGVAEGKYSEVLLKANPDCELLLVDPWHAYSDNPQNKTKEKNEFAYNEAKRRTAGYKNVNMIAGRSMDVIYDKEFDKVASNLDFVYIDGHHGYEYVMQDIIEWSKRVRSGGIVSGDDVYRLDPKWGAGPMEAVYHYTEAMKINPWFLINAHKSVDFFWVKS